MRPGRFARWILGQTTTRDHRGFLLADADENYRKIRGSDGPRAARRWYRQQVLGSLLPGMRYRLEHARGGAPLILDATAWLQGARSLRKHRLHTLAVVCTLGLGVGAATAVFSVAKSTVLAPLPYDDSDRLVVVESFDALRGLLERDVSGPDFFDMRERSRGFEALAAVEVARLTLVHETTGAQNVFVARVTASLFDVLRVAPESGHGFTTSDEGPDAAGLAVLTAHRALMWFGSAESALGREIDVDGERFTVVGVLPGGVRFPSDEVDLWLPLPYGPNSLRRQAGVLQVVGRLASDVSVDRARDEMSSVARGLEIEHPDSNTGRGFNVLTLRSAWARQSAPVVTAVGLTALLMLAVGAANAYGLILLRSLQRRSELGLRVALGATTGQLRTQLVGEGFIMGTLAGLVGIGLAWLAIHFVAIGAPALTPLSTPPALQGSAAAFAFGIAVLAALSATVSLRPSSWSGFGGTGARSTARLARARRMLVGGQIAATAVLIAAASALGESLVHLLDVDPGFEPAGLVAATIDLPQAHYPTDMDVYPDWPDIIAFYDRLMLEIEAHPDVEAAALAWHHPLKRGWLTRFVPEGQEPRPEGERDMVNLRAISPGYLATVGARLRAGRDVSESDATESMPVVLVNATLARRYFGAESAVGRSVTFFGRSWRIVGVVDDVRSRGLSLRPRPAVYPPLRQMPSEAIHLVVRAPRSAALAVNAIRESVRAVDPKVAPYDVGTLTDRLSASLAAPRFVLTLFGAFGVIALALSIVGIFGAQAQSVAVRKRELGVRIALGARRGSLFASVLREGLELGVSGLLAGLAVAVGAFGLLESWLYGVERWTPSTYVPVVIVLIVVTLLASAGPALGAMRSDPNVALRAEH